ncbi:MAG: pyridoxal phosphate-dependent aminotransferase [Ignavibacteria bacterium]|nr:pyridoxal phosphate-dependent aminotransferase [Ignavibacteria bacterium]
MFSKFFQRDFQANELFKLKEEIQKELHKNKSTQEKEPKIIDFTISNPTICNFDYSIYKLDKIFSNPNNYEYKPSPKGTEELRIAIEEYYKERFISSNEKLKFDKDNLFFTSGTSESYSYLFKIFCNPNDNVLIPKPGYPLIYYIAEINNIKTKYYNIKYKKGIWQIDFKTLEKVISKDTKCIIAINPNNPTGNYIKSDEFQRLIKICEEKKLPLIIDEVFYDYRKRFHPNSIYLEQFKEYNIPIFILNGLSKIAALPQVKLGWIYFTASNNQKEKIRKILEFICDIYLSVNTPITNGAPEILKSYKTIQSKIKERIESNLRYLNRVVKSSKKLKFLNYEGGWYAIIKVKDKIDDDYFTLKALREKYVFLYPGYFYEFDKDGYLVISLIIPEMDFREGIERILQICN